MRWNLELGDDGKLTKLPYQAKMDAAAKRWASSTNPKTWTSFDESVAACMTARQRFHRRMALASPSAKTAVVLRSSISTDADLKLMRLPTGRWISWLPIRPTTTKPERVWVSRSISGTAHSAERENDRTVGNAETVWNQGCGIRQSED